MVNCKAEGCKKRARYGPDGGKPRNCAEHRAAGEVRLVNNVKLCEYQSCLKRPSFGPEGTTVPLRCKAHSLPGDADVMNKRCEYRSCMKQPSFAPEGTAGAVRCKIHSLPGDVNVKNKSCEHYACTKIPSFGVGGRRLRCKTHSLPGDVCVAAKTCEHCPRYAVFGPLGGIAVRCKTHSLPDDVCMTGNTCERHSCTKQAVFSPEGSDRGLRCKEHSLPGDVDVVNPTCRYSGCYSRARYGVFSLSASYCSKHRDDSHVVQPRLRCKYEDSSNDEKCREYATHAQHGQRNKRIYCKTHATAEMVDYSGRSSGAVTPDDEALSE